MKIHSPISLAPTLKHFGFSPIPILTGKKAPGYAGVPMSRWSQYCIATASDTEIARWIAMDPQAGIGVACGYNGLTALDVDNAAAYAAVSAVFGGSDAPVKRGRTGSTAFFRDPTGLITSRKFLPRKNADGTRGKPLVEILGPGSQSVLPPSFHPVTHRPYVWVRGALPGMFGIDDLPVIAQAQVDELERLLEPLMEPRREHIEPAAASRPRRALTDQERARYPGFAKAAFRAEVQKVAQQTKPGRSDQLNVSACVLGKFVHHDLLAREEVAQALLGACLSNGLARENGPHDCLKTISRAFRFTEGDELPALIERPLKTEPLPMFGSHRLTVHSKVAA